MKKRVIALSAFVAALMFALVGASSAFAANDPVTFNFLDSEFQTNHPVTGENQKSITATQDGFTFSLTDDGQVEYYNYVGSTYFCICGCENLTTITAPEGKKISSVEFYLGYDEKDSGGQVEKDYYGWTHYWINYDGVPDPESYSSNDFAVSADGAAIDLDVDYANGIESCSFDTPVSQVSLSSDNSSKSPYLRQIVVTYVTGPYFVFPAVGIMHGGVKADVSEACEGSTVTVTPIAANGYVVDTVYYTAENNEYEIEPAEDGSYSFIMPASSVMIGATFIAASDDPVTDDDEGEGEGDGLGAELPKTGDNASVLFLAAFAVVCIAGSVVALSARRRVE